MFKNNAPTTTLLAIYVVTGLLPLALGQAYHFVIGHHQRNVDQLYRESNTKTYVTDTNLMDTAVASDLENINSTIIVTTAPEQSNELSQTAMDIITIVWYVATFLALAAFFLLMACSDRRCSDSQRNANVNSNEQPIPPPTPSPSYSEFAPPSYENVMKMQNANKNSIFVLPFTTSLTTQEQNAAKDGNDNSTTITNTNTTNSSSEQQSSTPSISYYTINEIQQKLAS